MRRLSPADPDETRGWSYYVVFIATIREISSYVGVLRQLRPIAKIVAHDEEARRVVIKAPLSRAAAVVDYLTHVAAAATAEIKLGTRLSRRGISPRCLSHLGFRVSMQGGRLVAFKAYADSTLMVEVRRGRLLAKYGRRASAPWMLDPCMLPPSLFTFMLDEMTSEMLDKAALRFMSLREEILGCVDTGRA